MSRLLRSAAFLLVTSAVSLVLLEVGLRVVMPIRNWFPEGMYVPDPDPTVGYTLAPGFEGRVKTAYFDFNVHVDADGHRSTGSTAHKRGSLVAFFGDSFMFGQGVEDAETVPAYFGEQLDSRHGVLNAGVYGYTPHQEFVAYQRIVDKWPIQAVVLQLFNNDVVIQGERIERGVYEGHLLANIPTDTVEQIKTWLLMHFEIVPHLRHLMYSLAAPKNELPAFLQRSFEKDSQREIESTQNLLLRWAEETKRRNQRFVLYWVPTVMEIDPVFARQRSQWAATLGGYDPEVSYRWLRDLCANRSEMEFVETGTAFANSYERGGPTLYIVNEGHTNPDGNRVIATELLTVLGSMVTPQTR